ncbi:MAG: RIP metalloprotease RseP [Spirochaetia bacterium]
MMFTVLLGIIGLGVMVFVHELGHFVAAKLNGVGVEVLSLGWGPRLAGFTAGGTTYQISWFPVGGYCKMKGELVPGIAGGTPDAAVQGSAAADAGPAPAAGAEGGPDAHPAGSFLATSPWRRIMIAAFGPIFNLIFALLVFALIWGVGFEVASSDNRVILATDYTLDSFPQPPPAAVAGLRTGDRVTAIDGVPTEKFQDILEAVSIAPGKALHFSVQRAGAGGAESRALTITPQLDKDTGAGRIGIYAWVDPVVRTVSPGSAAAIAGLRAGDRIVEADGRPVANTMDLFQSLAAKPGKLPVTYERSGNREAATLVFVYDEKGNPNLGIGFAYNVYPSPRMDIGGAVKKSVEETRNTIALTVKGFGLLFQGIKLRNAVAGPLRITYYIGTAATSGFALGIGAGVISFFRFLAFLSVVLFLMNLVPIPAMDGGQIVLFVVEIFRGKPVRSRLIWRLQVIGFSLLIGLSLFVTFSDVLFFMGR